MRKTEENQPADESREPFTIFAMTLQGKEGWHIEIGSGNLNEVICELEEQDIPVGKILSIIKGWQPLDVSPEAERRIVRAAAIAHNWIFDPQARFWCGPPDVLRTPAGQPLCVDRLDVTLGPPRGGWLPVSLHAGGQSIGTQVFSNYQRLPRLLIWLEDIVAGRLPRNVFSQGDEHLVLVTFPAEGERLRLSALWIQDDAQWRFDVELEKRELVRAFYQALRSMVTDAETFEREWRSWKDSCPTTKPRQPRSAHWVFTEHFSLEAERLLHRSLDSALVEEFLGNGE